MGWIGDRSVPITCASGCSSAEIGVLRYVKPNYFNNSEERE